VIERLHVWLIEHRSKVPDGSATAKAIDCSHQTMAGADAFPESLFTIWWSGAKIPG
jgi:hypothetical protein